MSNISDSLFERNVDTARPSTSQSTSQTPRNKCNGKIKEKGSPQKKNPKHSTMSRLKQPQDDAKVSTPKVFVNSSLCDVTSQCQNLNLNCESEDVDQGDSSSPKKKNKRNKVNSKKLHLQMPPQQPQVVPPPPQQYNAQHYTAQQCNPQQCNAQQYNAQQCNQQQYNAQQHNITGISQNNTTFVTAYETNTIQELFIKQIGPLYANQSSRYLENVYHHPQYQYINMNLMQNSQQSAYQVHPVSVPNTSMIHSPYGLNSPILHTAQQRPFSANIPTTPPMRDNHSPKYIQNMLNHPLLNRTFSMENYTSGHMPNQRRNNVQQNKASPEHNTEKTKKNKRRYKNKNEGEDIKFDDYISSEDVELGLNKNTMIEGVLRINPKQFQHSYVAFSTDRNEQDVLIDGIKNRNRALEGDVVIVQLLSDSEDCDDDDAEEKQKKGKIVYIKDKVHKRTCIGSLKLMPDRNRQKALFVPRDHRIPRLNIPFTCWPDNFYQDHQNYENTLFVAQISEWYDTRFAVGKILHHIGQAGDMLSETKAILAQTGLDITPFGPEVRHLYPRLDYTIPAEEMAIREDCRKMCIFSIDPSNCRDIDDAVSCRELENGNYEIGVHISDVAHFLTEGTILDEQVAEKATTVYTIEKAYHMLPDELCMLCSLFPGVDKLAFSVFWEMTEDAKVVSHRFSKTVIHSCCQLSYDHAQDVLENKEDAEANFAETYNGYKFKDIQKCIRMLGHISAKMRKKRFDEGALRIDQPKVSFTLDANSGLPESFFIYESKESHQLIEEFMLLANMTVAQRIYDDHPKLAFLRCHPPPSGFMLRRLAKSLLPMGIELVIQTAGDLHRSLQPHVGPESKNRGKAMVLNMLCAKPMTRARYFCAGCCEVEDDFRHYALNVELYTHFTSPIRRYADIMVHRLLAASLKCRPTPEWDLDKVRAIAAQCNKQKYNAKKASELSSELYMLKYIENHSPVCTEAVVVEVREKYIDVIIVAMGLNRRIFFNNDFPGQYKCIKNEKGSKLSKMEVVWKAVDNEPAIEQIIDVFSILQVEMFREDEMVKVETKLVRPTQPE